MTAEANKNKSGILNQIIVTVVIALMVGGTAPWWWTEVFGKNNETELPDSGREVTEETSGKEAITDESTVKIWKEGKLLIPLNNTNSGEVADIDNGRLLRLGTTVSASGADISIRQSVHSIIIEPGLSKGDGITFDARFIAVNDSSIGKDGCAGSLVSSDVSNHLQLSSDVNVGSHICMVTSEGRLAEFSITNLNLEGSSRNVEIEYEVWSKE